MASQAKRGPKPAQLRGPKYGRMEHGSVFGRNITNIAEGRRRHLWRLLLRAILDYSEGTFMNMLSVSMSKALLLLLFSSDVLAQYKGHKAKKTKVGKTKGDKSSEDDTCADHEERFNRLKYLTGQHNSELFGSNAGGSADSNPEVLPTMLGWDLFNGDTNTCKDHHQGEHTHIWENRDYVYYAGMPETLRSNMFMIGFDPRYPPTDASCGTATSGYNLFQATDGQPYCIPAWHCFYDKPNHKLWLTIYSGRKNSVEVAQGYNNKLYQIHSSSGRSLANEGGSVHRMMNEQIKPTTMILAQVPDQLDETAAKIWGITKAVGVQVLEAVAIGAITGGVAACCGGAIVTGAARLFRAASSVFREATAAEEAEVISFNVEKVSTYKQAFSFESSVGSEADEVESYLEFVDHGSYWDLDGFSFNGEVETQQVQNGLLVTKRTKVIDPEGHAFCCHDPNAFRRTRTLAGEGDSGNDELQDLNADLESVPDDFDETESRRLTGDVPGTMNFWQTINLHFTWPNGVKTVIEDATFGQFHTGSRDWGSNPWIFAARNCVPPNEATGAPYRCGDYEDGSGNASTHNGDLMSIIPGYKDNHSLFIQLMRRSN